MMRVSEKFGVCTHTRGAHLLEYMTCETADSIGLGEHVHIFNGTTQRCPCGAQLIEEKQ